MEKGKWKYERETKIVEGEEMDKELATAGNLRRGEGRGGRGKRGRGKWKGEMG